MILMMILVILMIMMVMMTIITLMLTSPLWSMQIMQGIEVRNPAGLGSSAAAGREEGPLVTVTTAT
jgi:hypothetical protein